MRVRVLPAEGMCMQCQREHRSGEEVFGAGSEKSLGDKLT